MKKGIKGQIEVDGEIIKSRLFNAERESFRTGKVKTLGENLYLGEVVAKCKLTDYEERFVRRLGEGGEADFERGLSFIVVTRIQ